MWEAGSLAFCKCFVWLCSVKSLLPSWEALCFFSADKLCVCCNAISCKLNVLTIPSPFISFISPFNIIGIAAEAGKHAQQHNSTLFESGCLPFPGFLFGNVIVC